PFDTLGETDFTQPDHYDLALAGRRCDVKSFLITQRGQIRSLRHAPQQLLDAQALVPLDQHRSHQHAQDIYLFAFVYALLTRRESEIRRASQKDQPFYWIHPMPQSWSRPKGWHPLAPLVLKSEGELPLRLEIGGQAEDGSFISTHVELRPRIPYLLEMPFFSLLYVHASVPPQARLGIRSRTRAETYLIHPTGWGNIWVYGLEILLVGWITWEEFNLKARVLPPGNAVLQYRRTRTHNLALPIAKLRPISALLEQVSTWKAHRR
ncbi:MAG: hypothetical protein ACK8QZ_04035, partial [Anaerolineales bacterium]